MRATAFLMMILLAGAVSADTAAKRAHEARAAWAWLAVHKAKNAPKAVEPSPDIAPRDEECKCASGYRCDCADCPCPGCPKLSGWQWSDDQGGYWWRPNPRRVAASIPVGNIPVYAASGFSGGSCRGVG